MSCSVSGGNASDLEAGWASDTTTSVAARLLNRPLTWARVVLARPVTMANAATPIAAPSIVSNDRTGRADTLTLASAVVSARPDVIRPILAAAACHVGTDPSPLRLPPARAAPVLR